MKKLFLIYYLLASVTLKSAQEKEVQPMRYWFNATDKEIKVDSLEEVNHQILPSYELTPLKVQFDYSEKVIPSLRRRSRAGTVKVADGKRTRTYKIYGLHYGDNGDNLLGLNLESYRDFLEKNPDSVFIIEKDDAAKSGIKMRAVSKKEFKDMFKEKISEANICPPGVSGIIADYAVGF